MKFLGGTFCVVAWGLHLKIMCIYHQDTWWSKIENYGAPHTGQIEIHRLTPSRTDHTESFLTNFRHT
jgi:hypothetical protein